jgi:hypothetical protein
MFVRLLNHCENYRNDIPTLPTHFISKSTIWFMKPILGRFINSMMDLKLNCMEIYKIWEMIGRASIMILLGSFCADLAQKKRRIARVSPGVFRVFSWNDIDVIKKLYLCPFGWHRCNFLIKKITSTSFQKNTRRTPEDVLAFLKEKRNRERISYMMQFFLLLLLKKKVSSQHRRTQEAPQ